MAKSCVFHRKILVGEFCARDLVLQHSKEADLPAWYPCRIVYSNEKCPCKRWLVKIMINIVKDCTLFD